MAFDMAICWIAAAATVGALIWMGTRNRHAGYRRERTDVPADVLMIWAAMAASEPHKSSVAVDLPKTTVDRNSADLMALGAFVGSARPVIAAEDHPGTPSGDAVSQPAVGTAETRRTR